MTDTQANAIYFRGTHNEGNKLKETGTTHWTTPNTGATNETGFTAIPGGYRGNGDPGTFDNIHITGNWWSSASYNADNAWYRALQHDQPVVYGIDSAQNGV